MTQQYRLPGDTGTRKVQTTRPDNQNQTKIPYFAKKSRKTRNKRNLKAT